MICDILFIRNLNRTHKLAHSKAGSLVHSLGNVRQGHKEVIKGKNAASFITMRNRITFSIIKK